GVQTISDGAATVGEIVSQGVSTLAHTIAPETINSSQSEGGTGASTASGTSKGKQDTSKGLEVAEE
ncbi:hypothetical protein SARC_15054, partial [Sphaeroforma arctica JP610]